MVRKAISCEEYLKRKEATKNPPKPGSLTSVEFFFPLCFDFSLAIRSILVPSIARKFICLLVEQKGLKQLDGSGSMAVRTSSRMLATTVRRQCLVCEGVKKEAKLD
jgi:hypothetical protein